MPIYIDNPDSGYMPPSWELLDYEETKQYTIGEPPPTFSPFRMIFRDFYDWPGYHHFKIRYYINQGSSISWLSLKGELVIDPTAIDVYGIFDVPVDFIPTADVSILSPGRYQAQINMYMYGTYNDIESHLQSEVYNVTLIVSPGTAVVGTDKSKFNLLFIRSTGQLFGDTKVSLTNNSDGYEYYIGFQQQKQLLKTDNNAFSVSANIMPGEDASGMSVAGSPYYISAYITDGMRTYSNFLVEVSVLENDGISVDETEINFSLLKSASETKTEKIRLLNPTGKAYTVKAPWWLQYEIIPGSGSDEIVFKTLNSSAINIGNYIDVITITAEGQKISISTSLVVINFLTSEFNPEETSFCLDKKLIKFYRINAAARFVKIKITAVFKGWGFSKTFVSEMSAVYFNERCEFDLGEKIHNYFPKVIQNMMQEPSREAFFNAKVWYNPAEVTVDASEIDADYNVLQSETISGILLLPGKKPAGFPWLTNHLVRSRLGSSKKIFSYVSGLVKPTDIAPSYANMTNAGSGNAVAVKTEDADGLVTWQNKKQFTAQGKTLTVYLREPGPCANTIQWENQNLMPEYLDVSGEFKKSKNKNHIYDKNLLNSIEKFDVQNTTVFNIDTGFILKAEKSLIDEMADARVLFFSLEGKNYRGFMTNEKIVEIDSSEELVRYDLEIIAEEV